MEGTVNTANAGEQSPATSTIEVDGLAMTVNETARTSWDAVMLARDLARKQRDINDTTDDAERGIATLDVLALMLQYVCYVTDLTRESISAHLGDYASVKDVASFLAKVMKAVTPKN